MPNVNQTELARLLGVSKPYIHKLVAKGILALDINGEIDLDVATAAIKEAASPGNQYRQQSEADTPLMSEIRDSAINASTEPDQDSIPPETPTADPGAAPSNYQQARAMREKYVAMNERLKFEKAAGTLLPADDVERVISIAFKSLAQSLESLPDALERDCGLSPMTVDAIQRSIDTARELLYTNLIGALNSEATSC